MIGSVLLETGSNGAKVLELVEEAFDEVQISIEEGTEGGNVVSVGHRPDTGPSSSFLVVFSQLIAIIARSARSICP